ncbi:MAG: tRNA ((37)-N6)-dimethylallyltransferase MiaA [Bacteroidota bacterium]
MKSPITNTLVIIAGPTAVGKTATAITIANHFGTEIISADSRQCYKELNIGVARPSEAELKEAPHHFIASHSIHEEVTAITFEQYALQITNELFQQHNKVVMVGGTGLYIKAFCEGLDAIPTIHPAIRKNLTKQYTLNGLEWLQQMAKEKDPAYFSTGEIQNPQRLMRALEVIEGTGHSITTYQKKQKAARDFNIIKIGLALPREILVQRIHDRVDLMLQQGQLEEVKSLISYQHLNALQTVGYAELFEHLNGKSTLSSAIDSIKTHTRQYAKRQMTWFKKDEEIKWFSPANEKAIIDYLAHK